MRRWWRRKKPPLTVEFRPFSMPIRISGELLADYGNSRFDNILRSAMRDCLDDMIYGPRYGPHGPVDPLPEYGPPEPDYCCECGRHYEV